MKNIERLLQSLCPEGVVYKAIDELAKTLSPQVKIKSHDYLDCGQYPVIDQGQDFIGGYTNDNRVFPKGEYIILEIILVLLNTLILSSLRVPMVLRY